MSEDLTKQEEWERELHGLWERHIKGLMEENAALRARVAELEAQIERAESVVRDVPTPTWGPWEFQSSAYPTG